MDVNPCKVNIHAESAIFETSRAVISLTSSLCSEIQYQISHSAVIAVVTEKDPDRHGPIFAISLPPPLCGLFLDMTRNLFSVPIFFIVFRETLEAAIIVSVLLGLVEQIVQEDPGKLGAVTQGHISDEKDATSSSPEPAVLGDDTEVEAGHHILQKQQLIRKLRIQVCAFQTLSARTKHLSQIFLGTGVGLLIALGVGAAFIAVWFTKASNLWAKSEELWEGAWFLFTFDCQVS